MESTSFNGDVKINTAMSDDVYVMTTSPKVNKISLLPFITRFITHEQESRLSDTPRLGCFPDMTEPLPMWRMFPRCCFPESSQSNSFTNQHTEDLPAILNLYPASTLPTNTEAGSLNYTNIRMKNFECKICGKKFTTRTNLNSHMMKLHTKVDTKVECKICCKPFATRASLSLHMRIHTDRTKIECEICCKKLATKTVLAVHMRIHTGDSPYKCPQCNMKFADISTFTKHKRIHSGDKPYKCNGCNKSFGQSGNLVRHRRTYNH